MSKFLHQKNINLNLIVILFNLLNGQNNVTLVSDFSGKFQRLLDIDKNI